MGTSLAGSPALARCDPRAGAGAGRLGGIEIEHIRKDHIRKEDIVAKVIERRGDQPGLVHVISAMEACQSVCFRQACVTVWK